MTAESPWWKTGVVYQIYPRSFADGNGDGVGDLAGIRSRLPYLSGLGVDALWITPFYPSPMADHGYDVADPRGVDPVFGDLADFDALLADAHERRIRVTIDLVPNHSSHQRDWFQAALAAPPGSPERERYFFRGARPGRPRAAEQLALCLRRPGVDAGAGRPVVPAPLRARAAGPELRQPRGDRRPRGDDAVLARPGRRRLPHRRRARHGQAGVPARHGPDGRHRAARRPRAGRPPLRPGRRARGAPADARGPGRLPRSDGVRRGVGARRRAARAVSAAGRAASGVQFQAAQRRLGPRRDPRRHRALPGHGGRDAPSGG